MKIGDRVRKQGHTREAIIVRKGIEKIEISSIMDIDYDYEVFNIKYDDGSIERVNKNQLRKALKNTNQYEFEEIVIKELKNIENLSTRKAVHKYEEIFNEVQLNNEKCKVDDGFYSKIYYMIKRLKEMKIYV